MLADPSFTADRRPHAVAGILALSMIPACAAQPTVQSSPPGTRSASIPLAVSEVESGHPRVEVSVRLGDSEARFLLDTGAPRTKIAKDERTARYAAARSSEAKGVADVATACDEIVVDSLDLGGRRLVKFPVSRCAAAGTENLLGLDALGEQFRIDIRRRSLMLDPPPSGRAVATSPLRRLRGGHLTLPARIGDVDIHVLFDTGADTTVVDSTFVAAHPTLFAKKRSEEGHDSTGKAIASEVYGLSSIRIGELELHDVEIATIPFSAAMRRDMGVDTPTILGTNVIEAGVWTFDLRANRWAVEAL